MNIGKLRRIKIQVYSVFTQTDWVANPIMFLIAFMISERKWVQYLLISERMSELERELDHCAYCCRTIDV